MINIDDLLTLSSAQLRTDKFTETFIDFCFDSRRVNPGELFVAFKTDHDDGHQYIDDALDGGATGVLCQVMVDDPRPGVTYLQVDDTQEALAHWATGIIRKYDVQVIAVTGSTGKTGAKEAIAAVLETHHSVYRNPWSFNGRFGLPLALGRLLPEHDIAVLEFGTDHFGEMADMVRMVQPTIGVVTDLSEAHIEHFGSLDVIAREKGELPAALPPDGTLILNADNAYVRAMSSRSAAHLLTISLNRPDSDLRADNVIVQRDGTAFHLVVGDKQFGPYHVPSLGRHRLYAVLAAVAVGSLYDITPDEAIEALQQSEPLPGRMQPLDGPDGSLLVDDTYSATPTSTLAALDWLANIPQNGGHKTVIIGQIDSATPADYETIGQRIATIADRLITVGQDGVAIAQAARTQGLRASMAFTHADAARLVQNGMNGHDVILFKGNARARLERVIRLLLPDHADAERLPRQGAGWSQVRLVRPERPTWVEIDRDAIAHNARLIKQHIGPDVNLMAVIKANAYGHGAMQAGLTALHNGATYLGVASINEALPLRQAGVDAPVLVLGYTPAWSAREAILNNVTVTLYDADIARHFEEAARQLNRTATVHIKIDTGMARLGLLPEQVMDFFEQIRHYKHLTVEGIFTHFSVADDADKSYTLGQLARFEAILDDLHQAGWHFDLIHCANSAAAMTLPQTHFNMVRTGIALYGINPSPDTPLPADFHPALSWKTTIAQVKTLPPGSYVSYGNTYQTRNEETIAVVPVGYADGFRRAPRTFGEVLVRGQRVPLVGRICMDQSMINVSGVDGVRVGDEVVIIGRQGDQAITAGDVAAAIGTINYEVVSEILARVPRI